MENNVKIYALHSDLNDFNNLAGDICQFVPVEVFDDSEALILSLHECSGVLLDLDSETRKIEKLIKSIRKAESQVPIVVLCNSLEGKKLQK